MNGLMTYDREVIKLDVADTREVAQDALRPAAGDSRTSCPPPRRRPRNGISRSTSPPPAGRRPISTPRSGREANGGFGTEGTPGAVIGTEWKTNDIWLRRAFELKELPTGEVMLRIHHDEDAEVYFNGVLAARVAGYTTDYIEVPLTAAGAQGSQGGKNVIAVHCHQTGGGQYIDVGLVEVVEKK